MSRLPSINEHVELADRARNIDRIAELVRSDLRDGERDGPAHTTNLGVHPFDAPSPASSSSSSGAASMGANGVHARAHFVKGRSDYSPLAHSPSPQAAYSPHSSNSRPYSPSQSPRPQGYAVGFQDQAPSEESAQSLGQPFRPRPTPASNFAALFPPPRAVTSVTNTHSTHSIYSGQSYLYQNFGGIPTPAPFSCSSSYSARHYQSDSQLSGSLGNLTGFGPRPLTSNSIGSPVITSLSNSISTNFSQTSSRSSSRAVSAAGSNSPAHFSGSSASSTRSSITLPSLSSGELSSTTGGSNYQSSGSVGNHASSLPVAPGFEPSLSSLPSTGLPSWPGLSNQLTSQSNQEKAYRSSSGSILGLPPHSTYSYPRASSSSSLTSHPSHLGTPGRYPQYSFEDEQEETEHELELVDTNDDSRSRLREHERKRESYGFSPQTYAKASPYTPYPSFSNSAGPGAGASAISTSYFHRDLTGPRTGLVTGGLLAPFTPPAHHSTIDRQRLEYTSTHRSGNQLSHLLSADTALSSSSRSTSNIGSVASAMNGNNMYHADIDMDPLESYDEDDTVANLPQASSSTYNTSGGYSMMASTAISGSGNKKDEKQVRRRSSKACDQCRKSKCKCERTGEGEPCKSCIMLGAQCTFLGPSRKRGPPKGYIDAIESRLHQTEALVGILLALANPERSVLDGEEPKPDERARSLLEDLRNNDPLAREIVDRVDRGAYGTKGRKGSSTCANVVRAGSGTSGDERSSGSGLTAKDANKSSAGVGGMGVPPPSVQGRGRMVGLGQEMGMGGLSSAHPSNEWQDTVAQRLKVAVRTRLSVTSTSSSARSSSVHPPDSASTTIGKHQSSVQDSSSTGEREKQRRRVGSLPSAQRVMQSSHSPERVAHQRSAHRQSISSIGGGPEVASPLMATNAARYSPPVAPLPLYGSPYSLNTHPPSASSDIHTAYVRTGLENSGALEEAENAEDEEGITDAVGQLSINEEAQVRFHGKASGLHLLGQKLRVDGRNKGGIWHFPKARVWPPVAPTSVVHIARAQQAEACERAARARLPARDVQEHLLELYFAHVHPFLPIVHKKNFWSDFRAMHDEQERDKRVAETGDLTACRGRSAGTSLHNTSRDRSTSTGHTGSTLAVSTDALDTVLSETGTSRLPSPRIPTLLLLAMFSIAARYAPVAHGTSVGSALSPYIDTSISSATSSTLHGVDVIATSINPASSLLDGAETGAPKTDAADSAAKTDVDTASEIDSDATLPLPDSGHMWTAGDGFLERAKVLLDRAYASSRPSTCQALLLMGYREIGIGAMAQSWLYVGMAVRMAQDLGMHRSSESWTCGDGPIFSPVEQHIRKRIWYACVVMDKYVSTYIGRPLAIFESDYDTQLPGIEESEELELWEPHNSMPNTLLADPVEVTVAPIPPFTPVPGRVLSCFNESARLSTILAMIVQAIYAVKTVPSRHLEALQLERTLDRWNMDLPDYLRYDTSVKNRSGPPPNVLILHMQYWCTVLLLHRPFIRNHIAMRRKRITNPDSPIDSDAYSSAQKSFDLCVSAANHITSIVSVYQAHFCLKRCSVFLSYYVFSAGIMHMTTMATNPNDPQASMGLSKCMDVLKRMEIVWPSAGRAWELLYGAKDDLRDYEVPFIPTDRPRKRSADDPLDAVPLEDPSYLQIARSASNIPSQVYAPSPTNGHRYGTMIDIGESNPPLSMFTAYNPWSSDTSGVFPSGLSTSVLPQQYSTGFADDFRRESGMRRSPSGMVDSSGRYSQYWSDYSMGPPSSMLSSMYGMSMPSHQSQHEHSGQHHPQDTHHSLQGQAPPVYMNDQYNMLNPLPP